MIYDRVLVTGGFGLIGSHLIEQLVSVSKEIIVLDDSSTGKFKNLDHLKEFGNIDVIDGSIADERTVDSLMPGIEICFHLAASLGVKKILSNSLLSYHTNVHGTENIVASASRNGTKVFMASTSEVYGKNPRRLQIVF
jgi:UDP-glucose 4-epimerase